MKIWAVVGTRPEAIKMAPVVRRARAEKRLRVKVCATAQHRGLLDQALRDFALKPDFDIDLMRRDQSPSEVLERVVAGLRRAFSRERPDLLLVQGDTTTVLGAALAAYYARVPVGHVEAGLRSYAEEPFPEEKNRVLVDHCSALLFAPTARARKNLLAEGLGRAAIFVTGNTVVDAVQGVARSAFLSPRGHSGKRPFALVTFHRRESFGTPLAGLFGAVVEAARRHPEIDWVYCAHPNPRVREAARALKSARVRVLPPLGYREFVALMGRSRFIVTDSGGIQEEAPSLNKPVIVARERTERPEALGRGVVLVGHDPNKLLRAVARLARAPEKKREANPFGDGRAADRIVRAILFWGGLSPRPPEPFRR